MPIRVLYSRSDRRSGTWARRHASLTWAMLAGLGLGNAALAQEEVGSRQLSVQPSVSLREVFTDNYLLSSTRQSDAITELGAGLRVTAQGSSIRGSLEYDLVGMAYAKHSEENAIRHQLAAHGLATLAEGQAYVDMTASITERALSAFGSLSTDGVRPSRNRDQATALSIAPYVVGRLGSRVEYRTGLRQEIARFKESGGLGFDRSTANVQVQGAGALLSWAIDGEMRRTRFADAPYADESELTGTVRYRAGQDLQLGATAGTESSELAAEKVSNEFTYGASLDWSPSPRTALRLGANKHYFGNTYGVSFDYRLERVVLTFADRRDLSTGSVQGVTSLAALNQLVATQFLNRPSDPLLIDLAARDFMRANGIDPNAGAISGFVANTSAITRTQELGVVYRGLRTLVSLRLAQGWTRQLSGLSGPVTDFQTSTLIRQRGILGDFSYRPTPAVAITLNGTWQQNIGVATAPVTELKSVGLGLSRRPTSRSEWTLGARYSVFNSPTDPYRESAGYLGYRMQF